MRAIKVYICEVSCTIVKSSPYLDVRREEETAWSLRERERENSTQTRAEEGLSQYSNDDDDDDDESWTTTQFDILDLYHFSNNINK